MKNTDRKMALSLVLVSVVLITAFAAAESDTTYGEYGFLIEALEEASQEHIIWDPIVLEQEETSMMYNATYALPEEGDLDQKEALRVALETLFALTDKTHTDIFNGYQITFSLNVVPRGTDRYWTVFFYVGEGKMGAESYLIEVTSPGGTLKRFEDITT